MHSSRMHTVRCSGRLSCHVCPLPCMSPLTMHAPLLCMSPFTTHTLSPCMPPHYTCSLTILTHLSYAQPPVDRMTDTCENITFPQLLLRTVKIVLYRSCGMREKCYFCQLATRKGTNCSCHQYHGVCSFCRHFAKLYGTSGFWEDVQDSFSCFYI